MLCSKQFSLSVKLRPYVQWRRQVSEFGGAFGGQTHILGEQDRIFKKVLLYRHGGTNILGISPPPQRGECPRNIAPPFRIFASHICDVVYSNNFVILSYYSALKPIQTRRYLAKRREFSVFMLFVFEN